MHDATALSQKAKSKNTNRDYDPSRMSADSISSPGLAGSPVPGPMRALPRLNVLMPGIDVGRARSRTLDITAMAGGDITRDISPGQAGKGSIPRRHSKFGSTSGAVMASQFMRKGSTPGARVRRPTVGSGAEDFRFNLFSAKEAAREKLRVQGAAGAWQQTAFARFYESDVCNQFLLASLFHFGALIRLDRMEKLFATPKKGKELGKDIRARRDLLRAKIDALQCQRELGSSYAMVLIDSLQHGSEASVQSSDVTVPSLWARLASNEEKEVFETILDFTCHFLKLCFDAKYYTTIDAEISTMFRSEYFSPHSSHHPSTITSSAKSKRAMPSLRTLAVLKYGQSYSNREFDERAVARLSGSAKARGRSQAAKEILKTDSIGSRAGRRVRTIHGAVRMRSPLISSLFPSADEKFQLQQLQAMEKAATAEADRMMAMAKGQTTSISTPPTPTSPRDRDRDDDDLFFDDGSDDGGASTGVGGDDPAAAARATHAAIRQGVVTALRAINPSLSIPLPFHDVMVKSDHWQSTRDHEKASLRAMSAAGLPPQPQSQSQSQSQQGMGLGPGGGPISLTDRLQAQKQFVGRRFSMLGPQIIPVQRSNRPSSRADSDTSLGGDSDEGSGGGGSRSTSAAMGIAVPIMQPFGQGYSMTASASGGDSSDAPPMGYANPYGHGSRQSSDGMRRAFQGGGMGVSMGGMPVGVGVGEAVPATRDMALSPRPYRVRSISSVGSMQ